MTVHTLTFGRRNMKGLFPADRSVLMTEDAATQYSRPAGLTLVASGLVHAVAPGLMLRLGRAGYGAVLNAEFRPRDGSKRRVRLIGLAMAATGAHLLYHGGIRPRGFE